jgi:hypothetical protein
MPAVRLIKREQSAAAALSRSASTTAGRQCFSYFEDLPGRRLRPEMVDRETALELAKAFARAERERLEQ